MQLMTDLPGLRAILRERRFLGIRVWFLGFSLAGVAFVLFTFGFQTVGMTIAFTGFGIALLGMVLHVAWIYQHRKPH
jgi:hypothetical protein